MRLHLETKLMEQCLVYTIFQVSQVDCVGVLLLTTNILLRHVLPNAVLATARECDGGCLLKNKTCAAIEGWNRAVLKTAVPRLSIG